MNNNMRSKHFIWVEMLQIIHHLHDITEAGMPVQYGI